MSCKVTRLSVIGMMVLVAPLAIAGCLAQESDEPATDESASELAALAVCAPFSFDLRIETCQSGWPGTRKCQDTIASATDIVPGTIATTISGHNGEVSHVVSQNGTRQIDFTATVHEGDVFSPGKNTTTYIVSWCRQPTN
jgi:hypothetical protein